MSIAPVCSVWLRILCVATMPLVTTIAACTDTSHTMAGDRKPSPWTDKKPSEMRPGEFQLLVKRLQFPSGGASDHPYPFGGASAIIEPEEHSDKFDPKINVSGRGRFLARIVNVDDSKTDTLLGLAPGEEAYWWALVPPGGNQQDTNFFYRVDPVAGKVVLVAWNLLKSDPDRGTGPDASLNGPPVGHTGARPIIVYDDLAWVRCLSGCCHGGNTRSVRELPNSRPINAQPADISRHKDGG
jgi:hypothetical protein